MRLTFLGTSSGQTSPNRYHSSILLSKTYYNLLIDTGDGISRALLQNGIDYRSIDGILFSHLHPDHFSGLPALIVQMKMINRKNPLDIFIHESLEKTIREFLLYSYLLPERINFNFLFKSFKDGNQFLITDDFSCLARKNSHLKDLEEYQTIYPDLSLYSASFLFESTGKKIIFTSDIGNEDDLLLFESAHTDVFISEVTHISLNKLLDKMERIKPSQVYLTHYNEASIHNLREILTNLPVSLKDIVLIAEDGLFFEI